VIVSLWGFQPSCERAGFAGSGPGRLRGVRGRFPVFVTHGNPGAVSHPCPKRRTDDELREKMNRHRIAPTGRRSARDRLPQLEVDESREKQGKRATHTFMGWSGPESIQEAHQDSDLRSGPPAVDARLASLEQEWGHCFFSDVVYAR